MQIFLGRDVILTRRRDNNTEVVNVEKLQRISIAVNPILDFIGRISYLSFPNLQAYYLYENHAFLIWEPLELSVS